MANLWQNYQESYTGHLKSWLHLLIEGLIEIQSSLSADCLLAKKAKDTDNDHFAA